MSRRRAPLRTNEAPRSTRRAPSRTRPSRAGARAPTSSSRDEEPIALHAKKKGVHRLTKVLVLTGLFVTVLGLGGAWALRQPFLRVQHVTVLGARHESVAQVLQVSGLATQPSMFALSSSAIERRLQVLPWVQRATLSEHWPNSVTLTVHEASPVAVAFNAKHQLQYVDPHGRDLGPAPLHANYPTLIYDHPLSATWPFQRAGSGAALVAAQLPRAFAAQVSQIVVDAKGVVRLKMTTPVTFILGLPLELKDKFIAIASVIAHSTLGPGDVVDVSVPGELAVTGPPPS
ncbi:MAG: cell division protein FtsQ/DivIB [Acidimicrobiales bacterium]